MLQSMVLEVVVDVVVVTHQGVDGCYGGWNSSNAPSLFRIVRSSVPRALRGTSLSSYSQTRLASLGCYLYRELKRFYGLAIFGAQICKRPITFWNAEVTYVLYSHFGPLAFLCLEEIWPDWPQFPKLVVPVYIM